LKEAFTVGDRLEVAVDTIAFGGMGVARKEGMVIFVPFAADGDELLVEIVAVRKRYYLGTIIDVRKPSTERVEPKCSSYYRCGGCQYQHLNYRHQLAIKTGQVRDSLERIGKISSPPVREIIPSPRAFSYRGKADYHVRQQGDAPPRIGFMSVGGDELVDIERCEIVDESINEACRSLRADIESGRRTLSGERLSVWSGTGYCTGGRVTRTVKGKLLDVPCEGFFQANLSLVDQLVDAVTALGDLHETDRVLDCYCGSGLFSLFMAPKVSRIFGIESESESVRCARDNLHQYGHSHARFFHGRVEQIIRRKITAPKVPVDLLLLDPPRTGCARTVLEEVAVMKPRRILYISCNPATLARDLRFLVESGFSPAVVQPVDMFPQTRHVEVIVKLERA